MDYEAIISEARRVLSVEASAVEALVPRVGQPFARAVEAIFQTEGRVIVSGMGKSGLVGKKIAATLASTGTPSFFMHPAEAGHGDLGMVTPSDIILAISNSGESSELVALIPFIRRFGIRFISMTGNPASTLAMSADMHLDAWVSEEACPLGIAPTASTTAAMALGDALAIALLQRRGFSKDDFAVFHPSGALGRKLLTRVRDLMHHGPGLPRVSPDTPMHETVLEMSAKRMGITTVVDERGALLGIISDGDIRRGVQGSGAALFSMRAADIMTRGPRTILESELAALALALMQEHAITALIATAQDGTLSGIIHIHDILKAGIT